MSSLIQAYNGVLSRSFRSGLNWEKFSHEIGDGMDEIDFGTVKELVIRSSMETSPLAPEQVISCLRITDNLA